MKKTTYYYSVCWNNANFLKNNNLANFTIESFGSIKEILEACDINNWTNYQVELIKFTGTPYEDNIRGPYLLIKNPKSIKILK